MPKIMEFIAKVVNMGDQKKVIIIPKNYWKLIEKEKLTEEVRVKIEKL